MTEKPLIYYELLCGVTEQDAKDASRLAKELSHVLRPVSVDDLRASAHQRHIYVARIVQKDPLKRGRIMGMASVLLGHLPLSGREALIEDVVVHHRFRRVGIGSALLAMVIETAKESGAHQVWLTSTKRGDRIAAQALYRKMGLKEERTKVFSLNLRKRK